MKTKQLLLFEAETRLRKTIERLERMNEIEKCGNVVKIEIPKIGHLLK